MTHEWHSYTSIAYLRYFCFYGMVGQSNPVEDYAISAANLIAISGWIIA